MFCNGNERDRCCTAFHNPRAAASGVPQLHRCADSQTATTELMINGLSGLWQQTEAITCSMFPLGLTDLIPHLGHIQNMRGIKCAAFVHTSSHCCDKVFVCPAIIVLFRMQKNILRIGAHPVVFIFRLLRDDSSPAKKTLITWFHTISFL